MADLALKNRLGVQPSFGTPLDFSNPITRGLVSAAVATESSVFYDSLRRKWFNDPYTGESFRGIDRSKYGLGRYSTQGGASRNEITIDGLTPMCATTGQWTIFAVIKPLIATTAVYDFAVYGESSGSWVTACLALGDGTNQRIFAHGAVTTFGNVTSDTNYVVNNTYAVAYTNDMVNGAQRLFINGNKQSGTNNYTGAVSKAFTSGMIQAAQVTSGVAVYCVYYFNRILTDAEVASLSANPWQLYRSPTIAASTVASVLAQAPVAATGPTQVGAAVTNTMAAGTSFTVSKTGVTAGNTLFLVLSSGLGNSTGPSVSDSAGQTWTKDKDTGQLGSQFTGASIWRLSNANAGTHTLTISVPVSGYIDATLMEWSGISSAPFDVSANNNSTTTVTTGTSGTTATTAQASELLIAGIAVNPSTGTTNDGLTTPAGWTNQQLVVNTNTNVAASHITKIVSATGTQSVTWTWTETAQYSAAIATYKAGSTAYSLPITTGSFTVTPATGGILKWAHQLPVTVRNITVTANSVIPAHGYKTSLTFASYAVTPSAVVPAKGSKIVGTMRSYTVTGNAAATGKGYKLGLTATSYTVTGNAATLTQNSNKSLSITVGNFAVTGFAATLTAPRKISAAQGAFTLTGNAAGLAHAYKLSAAVANFSITPSAVAPAVARKLPTTYGSFVETGRAPTLSYKRVASVSVATYAVNGYVAILSYTPATPKYLKMTAPSAGSCQMHWTSSTTWNSSTSLTFTCTLNQQTNGTPQDYHSPMVWLNVNGSTYTTGFALAILTNGVQLQKDGTPVADDGFVTNNPVGQTNTWNITYNGTSTLTIKKNGTTVLTYASAGVLAAGNVALECLDSVVTWDNVSGIVTDNFDNDTVGTYTSGTIGNWTIDSVGGTGNIAVTAAKIAYASTGLFTATGRAATLAATRKLSTTYGNFAMTRYAVSAVRARTLNATVATFTDTSYAAALTYVNKKQLNASAGMFVMTRNPVVAVKTKLFPVSAGQFHVNTFTTVQYGRSRAATMAMFQRHHNATQSELRRQLAAQLPLTTPVKTPQTSIKPSEKRVKAQRKRPLRTLPPVQRQAPAQAPVAPPQVMGYNDWTDSPDDEDALMMLLNQM